MYRNEGWVDQPGQRLLIFRSNYVYNLPTLFQNYKKKSLTYIEVALSKHATHYGPLSGFLYHNLTTTQREGEGTPYLQPVDALRAALWI